MKPLLAIFPQVTTAGGSLTGIIAGIVILLIAYFWWNHMMNKD
jgi:hypothetical protein